MTSDIEIARAAKLRPIQEIAAPLGVPEDALHPYGRHIAKIDLDAVDGLADRPDGRLILVTAISPTPAGEGKTTTTVGLGDALNRIGRRTVVCLREPSLGPCFGMKGGATGGGHAQVVPMERINLHFTGDFHAIGSAHNLLAAMVDNHVYWGNAKALDVRRITWRRVVDMNDRALRWIVNGLGGSTNGFPREDGFDITVASEVMAVFCLADSMAELEARLGRMVVGYDRDRHAVTAADLKAEGAMAVLLKDAFMPNLVQTLENNPAFVHGGPFANIAHGCNTLVATRAGLKLGDYVVTEAGFGADLGAQKFFDIKCRKSGLEPSACVVVCTIRALKSHGGVGRENLGVEDVAAVEAGLANLERHVANVRRYGVPVVVAVNHFTSDTEAEIERVQTFCRDRLDVDAVLCRHWAEGSAGAEALATRLVRLIEDEPDRKEPFRLLYADEMPLDEKIRTIACKIYGAADTALDADVAKRLRDLEREGFGRLPICMAKTQYSFAADPALRGAPSGHVLPVRQIRLSAGAEFVVAICGDIMTMPGLPRAPAAERMRLAADGRIEGLS